MSHRYERLLALSLVCGFLLFFFACSCDKENLIEPPDFFDPNNPQRWPICPTCGLSPAPGPYAAPPPTGTSICTGDNPTSGPLCIEYTISVESNVSLAIYTPKGEEVITLVRERQPAGTYTEFWELNDNDGNAVATGTYRGYFKAGDFQTHGDIAVQNP